MENGFWENFGEKVGHLTFWHWKGHLL